MRLNYVTLTVVIFMMVGSSGNGQHQRAGEGERKPEITMQEGVGPSLNYIIQARVIPDSALVRGQVDIQYRNLAEYTINHLYLDLGRNSYPAGMEVDFYQTNAGGIRSRSAVGSPRAYTVVDSVLYRASRLEQPPVMITDSIMQLTLPVGIAPGEVGALLVRFESRLTAAGTITVTSDNWFAARGWFPRLVAFDASCSGLQLPAGPTISRGPARYEVVLKVDSSYMLIAPGDLLNEKLHYGTFEHSTSDTVFTDVLGHMFAFSKEQAYAPTFESGIKDYYLILPSGFAFPIVIAKDARLDRAYVGELPIEVYYPGAMANRIQRRIAKPARRIVELYQQKLGVFPFPKVMIVAGDSSCVLAGIHELMGIGKDESSERLLYPYLVTQIAGCWFGDRTMPATNKVSIANSCVLASGIAYYVAMREMQDSLGDKTAESLEAYRKLSPRCSEYSFPESAVARVVEGDVPWEMRMLRFLIGDSLLWQSISGYSSEFRATYSSAGDFERIVAEVSGKDYSWFFRQWQQSDAYLDYYLSGVAYRTDDSGVTVEGHVKNHGNVIMPVELAFLAKPGDTLLDTLAYSDFDRDSEEASFSVHLSQRPTVVVIDPHHFLPDSDLDNNVRTRFGRRPRYREPWLNMPGFRW